MTDLETPASRALSYISHPRFHQRFTLAGTADHEALTVSYADIGRSPGPEDADPPSMLFIPGMFASRYSGVFMHPVAERCGVRVVIIDRPGMGASTSVPIDQRLAVWLETVPAILAHLGIAHVALASHSAGTIYLLNTLFHCRGILHPERPLAALLAPWTDPSHSHVTSMQMLHYLPAPAFSVWNRIPKFFSLTAQPALASSGNFFTKLSNAVGSGAVVGGEGQNGENRRRLEEDYGLARDVQKELDGLTVKMLFGEATVGANDEALLCVRKGGSWGVAGDYEDFVSEMVDLERDRRGDAGDAAGEVRLKVRTYFAESDAMIGKGGQKYVEGCWQGGQEGGYLDVLDFQTMTVTGTDHDSITQSVEVLQRVFLDAGGRTPQFPYLP